MPPPPFPLFLTDYLISSSFAVYFQHCILSPSSLLLGIISVHSHRCAVVSVLLCQGNTLFTAREKKYDLIFFYCFISLSLSLSLPPSLSSSVSLSEWWGVSRLSLPWRTWRLIQRRTYPRCSPSHHTYTCATHTPTPARRTPSPA